MPHDPQLAFLNSGKRNGEFSIAYDPRSLAQQNGTNYVYAATQELTLGTDVPFPACIIAKRTVVYVSSDGGQTWARAPGSDNLPGSGAPGAAFDRARLPQGQVWATDQSIRVASDGTVYLSILDDSPYTSCADPTDVQHAAFNQVELFTSPPGAKQFTGVVVTANSERATNPSTGDIEFFDLPQLAISPTNPNLAVLFYSQNFANAATVLRTVVRGPNGSVVGPAQTNLGLGTEAALAFDENGLLYAVNSGLGVKQLQFVSASSTWATTGVAGFPPGTTTNTLYTNFNVGQIPLDPDQVFSQDNNATPGLAVGTIAGDTEPTIFLAFETNTAIANVPSVSLIKSKVSQISTPSGWSTPIPFPGPADSVSIFHPAIALDPVANLLDVLVKLTEPGDGDDHTAIHSFWARYQANTLTQSSLMPPQAVEHQTPIAGQLPGREPFR